MKAILKFKLPDEENEFSLSLKGPNYRRALDEIDNHLRSKLKYDELSDSDYHLYENLRKFVLEQIHNAERND